MRDFSGSKSSSKTSQTTPYLFQSRHGVWYARVVVPKGSYQGAKRSELRRSLGTKCHREAIQRSWRVLEELTSQAWDQPLGNASEARMVPRQDTQWRRIEATSRKPADDSPKLSEVIKLFTAEKLKVNAWKPHEIAHNEFAYSELLEIVGDIRLSQFDGKVGLKYKQHFLDAGKLSVATINKRLGKAKNLLQWAVPHFGNHNPMVGMTIKQKVKVSEQRKAVSDAQVRRMLRAAREFSCMGKESYKRWIPFLGAYTGARIAEISQLYLDDFCVQDGLPCIHIRADKPDQSLKTVHSERIIPIHQGLINEGFLKFVEARRAEGQKRLFPELPSV